MQLYMLPCISFSLLVCSEQGWAGGPQLSKENEVPIWAAVEII